ncbi:MAG: SpoIID/LytB domain-containing protein [Chloroflexi bacterium]|nr:SpoIID/LytB domain-containing protein [Chloroflexota bacterium]
MRHAHPWLRHAPRRTHQADTETSSAAEPAARARSTADRTRAARPAILRTLVALLALSLLLPTSVTAAPPAWFRDLAVLTDRGGTVRLSDAAARNGGQGARLVTPDAGSPRAALRWSAPKPWPSAVTSERLTTAFQLRVRRAPASKALPLVRITSGGTVLATLGRATGGRLLLRAGAKTVRSTTRLPLATWKRVHLRVTTTRARRVELTVRLGTTELGSVTGSVPRASFAQRLVIGGTSRDMALDIDRVSVSRERTPPPEPERRFRIVGHGTDHGVGLSQWGARGRAEAGQAAAKIVTHYFPGTTIGTVRTDTAKVRINVLPWRSLPRLPVDLARAKGGRWRVEGIPGKLPAGARLSLVGIADGRWKVRVIGRDDRVIAKATLKRRITVRPVDAATTFVVPLVPSTWDQYAGVLHIAGDTDRRVRIVNELPMERYLRGVVPREMPPSWPLESLRAQAIVARSYAWKSRKPASPFDMYADARSQTYGGVKAEVARSTKAVTSTAGRVVKHQGSVAQTFYHSASGGATEDSWRVFTDSDGDPGTRVAYLRGVTDRRPDGVAWDAGSPYQDWQTQVLTMRQLGRILAHDRRTNVGQLRSVGLSDRGASGRLTTVTLRGSAGTKRVAGWVFKSVYNTWRGKGSSMLSTWFRFVDR